MGLLDDMMAFDAGLPGIDVGTTVIYKPTVGQNVTISNAIVLQNPPEKTGATPRGQVQQTQIFIPKSAYSTRPVLDGDQLQINGSSDWLTVVKITNEHDPGYWQLTVN